MLPAGLTNTGNTCYIISVIQALLSCVSFVAFIRRNNITTGLSGAILKILNKNSTNVEIVRNELFRHNKEYAKGLTGTASYAFTNIVQCLDTEIPGALDLFFTRKRVTVSCLDECITLEHPPIELTHLNINNPWANLFLESTTGRSSMPSNCRVCDTELFQKEFVTCVSDIIVIMLGVDEHGISEICRLNNVFIIPKVGGGYFTYKKKATIEYPGGHYTCRAERDGQIYKFNDNRVNKADSIDNLPNTVILFYELQDT